MAGSQDRNFDTFHQRFKQNIYASLKGRLRLAILERDLKEHLPALYTGEPWRILDAGGGMGSFSRQLAARGHRLMLCDISRKLLEEARLAMAEQACRERVEIVHAPFQQLVSEYPAGFDLVLNHAVLEWLAEPEAGIRALHDLIRPGGWLSLLFFNRNSLIYRHLLNGNFRKLRGASLAGEGRYLTPDNPQDPDEVFRLVVENGFEIVAHSGVRTFVDFMHRDMRDKTPFDELLEMELRFSGQEPFRSLGRYLHIIAQRKPMR